MWKITFVCILLQPCAASLQSRGECVKQWKSWWKYSEMRLHPRDEEREAGKERKIKGTIGPWRGNDHRSSSHLRGGEDDGGWGLGLLWEERTALLVQIVHLNFTEPQGIPSTLSNPLELCSFSRMLLTVLSALTERDPVRGRERQANKKAEHIPLLLMVVECLVCGKTPIYKMHQQQDTMTLSSEKRIFAVGGGDRWVFLQYSTVLGCLLRLNYRVLCIVVLLLFTVIAHHLKAHSYNQITHRRNVLFSGCTCESS